ncbi:MAG: SGNH/GDSL hydrolase family protein, partial [Polyangiales bacterium]
GWRTLRIKEQAPKPERYGLAGAALDGRRNKPAVSIFSTRKNGGVTAHASSVELYYWKQPNGGHAQLAIDGKQRRRIATASKHAEPGYTRVETGDGEHRIELTTDGDGPVRVFGAALERGHSGVVLDTLGIPGTRARDHLYWDDALYREHLARRHPDLVVLAYGTNESGDDEPIEQYESDLRKVVQRVREIAPQSSCLLIGPSDRPIREDDGTFSPRPRTDAVIDTQRRVALTQGCGFFDLRRFMGGPMSMLRWVAAVPPMGNGDYVHFTAAGYERLGNVLYDALLEGFSPAPAAQVPPRAVR